jgi:hypothetical protein
MKGSCSLLSLSVNFKTMLIQVHTAASAHLYTVRCTSVAITRGWSVVGTMEWFGLCVAVSNVLARSCEKHYPMSV